MKQKFKDIISNPKVAISIVLAIAIIVGIISTIEHNKKHAALFTGASMQSSATTEIQPSGSDLTLSFATSGQIKSVSIKVGDSVKKGQVLASLNTENTLGAVTQAQGAYAAAQANYQKVINGATSTSITVAKDSVATAQTNLDETTKTQNQLVQNAYDTLLSQGLQISVADTANTVTPPTLSGSYTKGIEGSINITTHQSYFTYSGIISGTGIVSTTTAQPIGDSGLYITFANLQNQPDWIINIPNTNSSNYLTNYNAYQTALQTQEQSVVSAKASLTQAEANLTNLQVAARPEDVAAAQAQVESTQGALQIAQGIYNNSLIVAPQDGTITNISITAGQTITANTPAIELITK